MKAKEHNGGLSVRTLSLTAWLFPLAVLLLVVLASMLVLMPQAQRLMSERTEFERKEETLSKLVEKRSFLDTLNEAALSEQVKQAARALPNDKPVFVFLSSLLGLVEEIEDLRVTEYDFSPGEVASDSAAEVAEEKTEQKAEPGVLQELPITISFEGSLETILDLVEKIEGMAPLADVYGFALQGDLNDTQIDEENRQIEMQLNLYYAYPPSKIAAPETLLTKMSEADRAMIETLSRQRTYEGIDQSAVEAMINQNRENPFKF